MNSFLQSSAALGISAVLCTGGCSGAYPNYSCSATSCSLATVASSPTYPLMMLAVAKTTTIISLSDDPVTDGIARASAAEAIKGDDSGEELAER